MHIYTSCSCLPPHTAAPLPGVEVLRRPEIQFFEKVIEGRPADLVVRLADLIVEGKAMTVKRERDPNAEQVKFRVTAENPGPKPVVRELIASFWQDNNCIGAVTHNTTVIPANYTEWVPGSGGSRVDTLRLGSRAREDADLVIYVRGLKLGVFDVAMRSRVLGQEYDMRSMGELKLVGTEFEDFFKQVVDPQFSTFPRDPTLTDEEFDKRLAGWNGKFMTRLADLGRTLWTLLPQPFRDEYLRLMNEPTPPRARPHASLLPTAEWRARRPRCRRQVRSRARKLRR
jgi:hypothetical protein